MNIKQPKLWIWKTRWKPDSQTIPNPLFVVFSWTDSNSDNVFWISNKNKTKYCEKKNWKISSMVRKQYANGHPIYNDSNDAIRNMKEEDGGKGVEKDCSMPDVGRVGS